MALPNSQTWGPWFKSCSSLKTRQFSNVKLETSLIRHWPNNFFYATMVEKMSSTLCTDRTIGLYKKVPFKNWAAIKTMTRTIKAFFLPSDASGLVVENWIWPQKVWQLYNLYLGRKFLGSGVIRTFETDWNASKCFTTIRSARPELGRSSAGARLMLGQSSASGNQTELNKNGLRSV